MDVKSDLVDWKERIQGNYGISLKTNLVHYHPMDFIKDIIKDM